jgi:hypothetical protein
MRVIELTLGSGATQVTPNTNTIANQGQPIYVSFMLVQPAADPCTIGDNTVTATKGIVIAAGVAQQFQFQQPRGSLLSSYYIFGTQGAKVEILYETTP